MNATVTCYIVTRGSYADRTNVCVLFDKAQAEKFVREYNAAYGYGPTHMDAYSVEESELYINGWKAKRDATLIAQQNRQAETAAYENAWYY